MHAPRRKLPGDVVHVVGRFSAASFGSRSSGYVRRPQDFEQLIRILDPEIRLITPTDPEGFAGGGRPAVGCSGGVGDPHSRRPVPSTAIPTSVSPSSVLRYYQLTHDYLVPSIRDWLTRKQKETRQGRAELRFAERAALWNAKPERQQLPSLWEYINIRLFTTERKT